MLKKKPFLLHAGTDCSGIQISFELPSGYIELGLSIAVSIHKNLGEFTESSSFL